MPSKTPEHRRVQKRKPHPRLSVGYCNVNRSHTNTLATLQEASNLHLDIIFIAEPRVWWLNGQPGMAQHTSYNQLTTPTPNSGVIPYLHKSHQKFRCKVDDSTASVQLGVTHTHGVYFPPAGSAILAEEAPPPDT